MTRHRYTVTSYDAAVEIDADDPNDPTRITYSGPAADALRLRLVGAYGAFGHAFNADGDTLIDLDAALHKTFPGQVQHDGPTITYDPGVPDDVQT